MYDIQMIFGCCIIFSTCASLYSLIKIYKLYAEDRKQRAWNDQHHEWMCDLDRNIDSAVRHVGNVLEHDKKCLEATERMIKECSKVNSDAEELLALYRGVTQQINNAKSKVVVPDSD